MVSGQLGDSWVWVMSPNCVLSCGFACLGKDGRGEPVFTGEVDCTYFFTWDTKYACIKEKEDLLCGAINGKKRYDLSVLARHSGIACLSEDSSHRVHRR
jgi:hypothetical protein